MPVEDSNVSGLSSAMPRSRRRDDRLRDHLRDLGQHGLRADLFRSHHEAAAGVDRCADESVRKLTQTAESARPPLPPPAPNTENGALPRIQQLRHGHRPHCTRMSHGGHIYFDKIGNMKNSDAIAAFLALGQETRLNIFRLVVQRGETGLTPSELVERLGIPNATLSFHLKELARAGLLLVERQSRHLIYRPNAALVEALSGFLLENCCGGQPCTPVPLKKKVR